MKNEDNNTKTEYFFDNKGKLEKAYIIETEFHVGLIWEKRIFTQWEEKPTKQKKYYLDSREIYSYDKDFIVNKIVKLDEGGNACSITFKLNRHINESLYIIEAWQFDPQLKRNPFILATTFIEKKITKYKKPSIYRVRSHYVYSQNDSKTSIELEKKFRYNHENPEQLMEIIESRVENQYLFLNLIRKLAKVICSIFMNTTPWFDEPILRTKQSITHNINLPNKIKTFSKPTYPEMESWNSLFRDQFSVHETLYTVDYFSNLQIELDQISKTPTLE